MRDKRPTEKMVRIVRVASLSIDFRNVDFSDRPSAHRAARIASEGWQVEHGRVSR